MVPKDLDRLIEKYLEGKCTQAERAVVQSLYASPEGKPSGNEPGVSLGPDEKRAHRILSRVETHEKSFDANGHHRSYLWHCAAMAASLVFFLLTAGYYSIKPQTQQNAGVYEALSKTHSIHTVFDQNTLFGCVLVSSFYEEGLYDRIDVICTAIEATYPIADARIFIESLDVTLNRSSMNDT